jgi:translation elongation factor EF-Tu-like GTPase
VLYLVQIEIKDTLEKYELSSTVITIIKRNALDKMKIKN